MSRKIYVLMLALLSLSAPSWASIIYVSGDQTGAWSADTVIVTGEVRVPPNMSLTILPGVEVLFSVYCKLIVDNGATLRAVGTPVDSIRFDVLPPDTAWHGIRFLSASDSSRLEYCILTHGSATGSYQDQQGGAVYCSFSSPIISYNTISGNFAFHSGGGICCSYSNPTISANTINGNSGGTGSGGGIFCWSNSNPSIINNTISGNSTAGHGGGISCFMDSSPIISGNIINQNSGVDGGGIDCVSNSSPIISGNTIGRNSAPVNGGGIFCSFSSNPSIDANIISGNSARSNGGGIHCYSSSPSISGNTISGNTAGASGGGIASQVGSDPTISGNTIIGNTANEDGGGIYCDNSNPTISGNTISGNSAAEYGGGIYGDNSNPTISGNTLNENSAFAGGGITCWASNPSIIGNTISGNLADYGGGISCMASSPSISGNTMAGNSAIYMGGGIDCQAYSNPIISGNTIRENTSTLTGGGISCVDNSNAIIIGNTISGNLGGGISCEFASVTLVNCILWGNNPQQIYVQSGTPQVTYSDVQGGWTGTGNINAYPAFVDTAQHDYRLQWGSPCIDSGDPNPIYNDPDLTRADMGAWYYDQSMPVRLLLTPYNSPIQIPAIGGSFQYALHATNIASTTLPTTVWCDVTLPNGNPYGPVLGPVTISLASGQTLSRVRAQTVPAGAPAGLYHYNALAVAAGDTSTDSFTFVKLGDSGQAGMTLAGGWTNTGEEFDGEALSVASPHPSSFILHPCAPNPFNPTTTISYQLSADSHVSLKVYNTAGRRVAELVNGWRDAGSHEVTFDASGLPSGIYFAKLTAGEFSQVQKLVLMK